MAKTEKPNMFTRLKKKMTQKGRDKYMIFRGNKKNFVRNGALLLEESIALFHGKANPVRHLSVDDLNNMNVEPLPYRGDGFYYLYQGSWEGRVVLVKKSSLYDYDFFHVEVELFLREIVVATQMATHKNAHKILGCCLETDIPVIVYEWMPPNTLEDRICPNDANQSKAVLEWKDRLRIAWEISHVAAYLHTAFPRPIIHKDLKPSNVFLNQDNAVKLGDFSRCVSIPEGEEFIKDMDIVGTIGYIAPEYHCNFKVAKYTDVYSFGVLFLVLLTGKRPYPFSETTNIITWVRNGVKNNHVNKIVDPTITRNGVTSIEDLQLRASAQLAIRCVSKEEDCRPTMVEVATELKNMIRSLEEVSFISSSPLREKKCKCGVPFAELTSWTRENPGRKFRTCKFYDVVTESRGCKAFEWVDEPDGTAWQTEVINNLLLDKKLLKGENTDYKREVDDLGGQMRCLLNEVDNLKMKCNALNSDKKKIEMHGRMED